MALAVPDLRQHLRAFVLFVGTAHSGHSVVGAILDTHPRIAIANEFHVLPQFHRQGVSDEVIQQLAIAALGHGPEPKWINTGYDYSVSRAAQGRVEGLRVLGDKKAGASSAFTLRHPQVCDSVLEAFGRRLRIVHVVRNPFDNVAAIAFRRGEHLAPAHVERYARRLDGAIVWRRRVDPGQLLTLHHEDLLERRDELVRELFEFVGERPGEDLIGKCSAMLYPRPRARRREVPWGREVRDAVQRLVESQPYREFLGRYAATAA